MRKYILIHNTNEHISEYPRKFKVAFAPDPHVSSASLPITHPRAFRLPPGGSSKQTGKWFHAGWNTSTKPLLIS